jgi:hypothetical protein
MFSVESCLLYILTGGGRVSLMNKLPWPATSAAHMSRIAAQAKPAAAAESLAIVVSVCM